MKCLEMPKLAEEISDEQEKRGAYLALVGDLKSPPDDFTRVKATMDGNLKHLESRYATRAEKARACPGYIGGICGRVVLAKARERQDTHDMWVLQKYDQA